MKNSIKSVLSLVSVFMLIGCTSKVSSSSSNNKTSSSSIKVLTKEEKNEELMKELNHCIDNLQALICKINITNCNTIVKGKSYKEIATLMKDKFDYDFNVK